MTDVIHKQTEHGTHAHDFSFSFHDDGNGAQNFSFDMPASQNASTEVPTAATSTGLDFSFQLDQSSGGIRQPSNPPSETTLSLLSGLNIFPTSVRLHLSMSNFQLVVSDYLTANTQPKDNEPTSKSTESQPHIEKFISFLHTFIHDIAHGIKSNEPISAENSRHLFELVLNSYGELCFNDELLKVQVTSLQLFGEFLHIGLKKTNPFRSVIVPALFLIRNQGDQQSKFVTLSKDVQSQLCHNLYELFKEMLAVDAIEDIEQMKASYIQFFLSYIKDAHQCNPELWHEFCVAYVDLMTQPQHTELLFNLEINLFNARFKTYKDYLPNISAYFTANWPASDDKDRQTKCDVMLAKILALNAFLYDPHTCTEKIKDNLEKALSPNISGASDALRIIGYLLLPIGVGLILAALCFVGPTASALALTSLPILTANSLLFMQLATAMIGLICAITGVGLITQNIPKYWDKSADFKSWLTYFNLKPKNEYLDGADVPLLNRTQLYHEQNTSNFSFC